MTLVHDLNFDLPEGENILASSKNSKLDYYFYSFLFIFSSCVVILFSTMFISRIFSQNVSLETKDIFFILFLVFLVISICYGAVDFIKNTKNNKLYLTNKRFIVVTKDSVKSIEFSNVKNIRYSFGDYFLRTNDRRTFKFFSSVFSNKIIQFRKINKL